MAEYISKESAVDAGYLSDWYISSVGDEPPIWTDAHIDELLNDFIVIPKETKSADVQPVKRGWWKYRGSGSPEFTFRCSCCENIAPEEYSYCSYCGARMDGDPLEN